jgi:hypothetical protein
MKIRKRKAVTAIIACICILACFPIKHLMAQAIDLLIMNPDERKAAQSKIEAASRVDSVSGNLIVFYEPVKKPNRLPNYAACHSSFFQGI